MTEKNEMRFEFGRNWHSFVRRNLTQERCKAAKERLLRFAQRENLTGFDFLDIGCGSGLHSFAAYEAGCSRIYSFDYDPQSVAATNLVRQHAGNPERWHVERGDILDPDYVAKLGKWSFVYSWGVLHHTGNVWQAIRNAQSTVADDGYFYIALYSSDVEIQPSKEFWLDVKKAYNRASRLKRTGLVWWYIWRFMLDKDLRRIPQVIRRAATYKLQRGMNLFSDIRDWLGGWPMEYTADQEVVDLLEQEYGFTLVNITTGEACSEFLFHRTRQRDQRTLIEDMVAARTVQQQS